MAANRSATDAFAELAGIVAELRVRCPWDRDQKLGDTPRHLIEEAYEVADAVARGDLVEVAGELGDLIAQCLLTAVILAEQPQLDLAAVLHAAAQKLIRRHPHVYGDARADSVEQVLENWERIKEQERAGTGQAPQHGLATVGRGLPALMRAEKLGQQARRAGMDWADVRGVIAKAREELDEVEAALDRGDSAAAADEVGDLLLALANAPRFIGQDAEQTLRRACDKFVARFDEVARLAAARGLDLKALQPDEIESLWQAAKKSAPAAKGR